MEPLIKVHLPMAAQDLVLARYTIHCPHLVLRPILSDDVGLDFRSPSLRAEIGTNVLPSKCPFGADRAPVWDAGMPATLPHRLQARLPPVALRFAHLFGLRMQPFGLPGYVRLFEMVDELRRGGFARPPGTDRASVVGELRAHPGEDVDKPGEEAAHHDCRADRHWRGARAPHEGEGI